MAAPLTSQQRAGLRDLWEGRFPADVAAGMTGVHLEAVEELFIEFDAMAEQPDRAPVFAEVE